jgi:hypothetical protein
MAKSQTQSQALTEARFRPLAVLTGDIIRSSRLSPQTLDAAMEALARGAAAMSAWDGAEPARFDRFRGDGWQCLAPSPAQALRATLFLRAHVRALDRDADTRICAGIGAGEVPGEGLASAGGPAFEVSGRGLDRMARAQQLAVDWADPPSDAAAAGAVFALADEISRLWTARQAELLIETLAPGDEPQERLAAQHGVSQQAVAKHLSRSGEWALRRAIAALETPR